MKAKSRRLYPVLAASLFFTSAGMEAAKADPQTVTICSGALEPATITTCTAVGLVAHELLIAKKPFGPHGGIAKGARVTRDWIGHRTGLQKATKWLRARTGIKW